MGRKSKKKGKGARRSNAARSQPSAPDKDKGAPPPGAPPPGASCWICLDEEPDDEGRPIVRDCSCRGASAGFAHLSCLVQYAEQKCGMANGRRVDPHWLDPFAICPNCNQQYHSQLFIDMATACVDFVDQKQPECLWRRMGGLQIKLGATVMHRKFTSEKVEECEKVAQEFFSVLEAIKSNPNMKSLLPYVQLVEGDSLMILGNLHLDGRDEENGRKAVSYYERARERKVALGLAKTALVDARIAEAKAMYEGKQDDAEKVKNFSFSHQSMVKQYGENSPQAIQAGLDLAYALSAVHRGIEAERLSEKLATISRRVHGPEHNATKAADVGLQALRVRRVVVQRGNDLESFQALRYVSSGKKCVVQGPIQNPRNTKKETTLEISAPITARFGTPVICQGLKSAPELNGKLGDVRGTGEGSAKGRYLVHLEGRKKPILVKPENLRITFDLPEPTVDESG